MNIDFAVETRIEPTSRVQLLSAMFDCPMGEKSRIEWHGELPIESIPWNCGLIVGPSGSGKTSIARQVFGAHFQPELTWGAGSVIDDFAPTRSMEEIAAVCQAVGFNTIPAWARPYAVLSNGERFRVELARRLLELPDPIVVDEFTSVVDRQVAQIGAHAVQKYVRRTGRKFVAVTCHYDVADWLNPDWILESSTMAFTPRGSLQRRRPPLDITICGVPYSTWRMFAPFHYLTAALHKGARCFGLFVGERIASFAGVLHRPHPTVRDIMGISRLVTLPDWQGLGLAMALCDKLGAAYKTAGKRLHMYPAHPSLIRSFDLSKNWLLTKRPGTYAAACSESSTGALGKNQRPCAVFCYVGEAMPKRESYLLLAGT